MNKFAKLLVTALAACFAMAAFAQSNPKDLLKSINDYSSAALKSAMDSHKQPDFAEIDKQATAKALEAIKNVDPTKVNAKDAYDWAGLFQLAGHDKEACDLCHLFLTTNPAPAEKFQAQMRMMRSCNTLGETDMLMATLKDTKPTDFNGGSQLASQSVYQFANTIQKSKGTQAAIDSLNEVEKSLPEADVNAMGKEMYDRAKQNPNYKGTGTDDEQLQKFVAQATARANSVKLSIAQKKAELYNGNNQKDEAVKTLDAFSATLKPGDRMVRQVGLVKTQITLPGSPSPAIVRERGYGDFPGLEAMKGKVVILDFFAHWCGPCIASFPEMKKLYADLKDKGVEVVGVTTYYGYYKQERNMDKDTEFGHMQDFIKEHDMTWPVVYGERSNFDEYGVTGIPHVVLIDRAGIVHKIHIGYSPQLFAEFRKEVEALVAQK